MKCYKVIIGLRALDPLPVGFGSDCLPGYLTAATERHRRGFELPGLGWFAFTTNPLAAKLFEPWETSNITEHINAIGKADNGRFRPLVVVEIYR